VGAVSTLVGTWKMQEKVEYVDGFWPMILSVLAFYVSVVLLHGIPTPCSMNVCAILVKERLFFFYMFMYWLFFCGIW